MRRRSILILFPLCLLAAASCSQPATSATAAEDAGTAKADAAPPSTNVHVAQVTLGRLVETVALNGETRALRRVTLGAETMGRVQRVGADIGDTVTEGQELVRIDYDMQDAQLAQARADLALAGKTYRRLQRLRESGATTVQELDVAKARRDQARVAVRIAELRVAQSVVLAPQTGVVTRRMVEVGEVLAPGQPVFEIVDLSAVIVAANAPERQVGLLKPGLPAVVEIEALGRSYEGVIHIVIPTVHDPSRTYEVRVELPNPDRALLSGMFAQVRIVARTHDGVVVVPQEVVLEQPGKRVVFVARDDGTAEQRTVALGPVSGRDVLVREGLAPGDRLIVDGHRDLVDRQRITVTNDPASADAGPAAPPADVAAPPPAPADAGPSVDATPAAPLPATDTVSEAR